MTYSDITNLDGVQLLHPGVGHRLRRSHGAAGPGNVIHQCGHVAPNQDHGIYVDNTTGATITDNIFWGMLYGYALHFYPGSNGNTATHNVIDDGFGAAIFGGNTNMVSNNNLLAYNVITSTSSRYAIDDWWGGSTGTGNQANNNCLYNNSVGDVASQVGFTASSNQHLNPQYVNQSAQRSPAMSCRPEARVSRSWVTTRQQS